MGIPHTLSASQISSDEFGVSSEESLATPVTGGDDRASAGNAGGFAHFNLALPLVRGLKAASYHTPTPIQERSIPIALGGRDVLGLAQTGTGKTAAFALPILHRLISTPPPTTSSRRPRVLVLAPTRELADQIAATFKVLAGPSVKCATVYGGVGMGPQIDAIRRGTPILVGCPGRVLDHVQQRTLDLSGVEVLVLDEADHMFDMGFLPTVRRILNALPRERQTMMFSATMPPEIRKLTDDVLRDPAVVKVDKERPVETVSHYIYPIAAGQKQELLMKLLGELSTESVLVFTRTKHGAKKVTQRLELAGYAATCLQGNLSQNRRQEALAGFRSGKHRILVATDIAARGIDVASVSHVINFDMPATVEAYTHRIGRTGRASREGDAISFMTADDNFLVQRIERVLGERIERRSAVLAEGTGTTPKVPEQRHATSRSPNGGAPRSRRHDERRSRRSDTERRGGWGRRTDSRDNRDSTDTRSGARAGRADHGHGTSRNSHSRRGRPYRSSRSTFQPSSAR